MSPLTPWRATVMTLFPAMFPGPLGEALAGKALAEGLWQLDTVNIRDFGLGNYAQVDDTPYGGGAGMVMRADVLEAALNSVDPGGRPLIYLTPRGAPLTQAMVRDLSQQPGAVVLCGRYEGVDQRFIDHYPWQEISIGDYILAGGEVAAMVLLEAVTRLLPGVMGKEASHQLESFEGGLLEHPHYTRPAIWQGREVPEVLASGHHKQIDTWRQKEAEALTQARRPDMWAKYRK
jgi:tRNA (guanine37-N1)-methyltransferase